MKSSLLDKLGVKHPFFWPSNCCVRLSQINRTLVEKHGDVEHREERDAGERVDDEVQVAVAPVRHLQAPEEAYPNKEQIEDC